MTSIGFAQLIAPNGPEHFLSEFWERKHLHVARDDAEYFAGLFSMVEFERALWSDASWGRVQLANHRRGPEWVDYTTSPPTVERLAKAYAQGDTLVVNDLHERVPALAKLCRSVEAMFHLPVNLNLYLTPALAQGLSLHFDTQDVLILQLEGKKRWSLHESMIALPLDAHARDLPEGAAPPHITDVVLAPGDVLYLPRGMVHAAHTEASPSMHLTIGINPLSVRDLLVAAVDELARENVALRRSLPAALFTDLRAQAILAEELSRAFQDLPLQSVISAASMQVADRWLSRLKALPADRFTRVPDTKELSLDSELVRPEGMLVHLARKADGVCLKAPQRSITGPEPLMRAFQFVAERARFLIRELPGLSESSRLVLARRLLTEGIVERA